MAKFCGNCGAMLDDNEKFCGSCGASTEPTPVQVKPVAQPAAVDSSEDTPVQQPMQSGENVSATYEQPAQNTAAGSFEQPMGAAPTAFAQQPQQTGEYNQQAAQFDTPAFNNGGATAANPANKKLIPLVIGAAAIIVVIIAVILIVKQLTRFQKIDAKDLIKVSFSGPDGYGVCSAQLNVDPELVPKDMSYDYYEDLYSSLFYDDEDEKPEYSKYLESVSKSKLLKVFDKAGDKSEAEDMQDALLKTKKNDDGDKEFVISAKASVSDGLKNGDKVKITVKYDEDTLKENDIKLENTEFEVEVKGLKDSVTLDAFEGLKVEFSGTDGSGDADINDSDANNDLIYYSWTDAYPYNVSNGDKLSVTASLSVYDYDYLDDEDHSKGIWFEKDDKCYIWPYEDYKTTKEYTVEGLTELEEIDPFENIEFSYSGAVPYLHISGVEIPEDSVLDGNVSYTIDNDYDTRYNVGDTFTVKCYAYYSLADAGYKLKGEPDSEGYYTKEFTVDDTMPAYIDGTFGTDDLKDADETFEKLAKAYQEDISGSYLPGGVSLDSSVQSVKSMNMIGEYVINPEGFESGSIADGTYNYYGRIYELDLKLKDGTAKVYVYLYASNVSVCDGKVYVGSTLASETSDYYFSRVADLKKNDLLKTLKENGALTELTAGSKAGSSASTASTSDSTSDSSSAADSSTADSSAATTSVSDSSAADSQADSKADDSSETIVP